TSSSPGSWVAAMPPIGASNGPRQRSLRWPKASAPGASRPRPRPIAVASVHSARSAQTPFGEPVTGRHRTAVAALVLLAALAALLLVAFSENACPTQTASSPCPQAGMNRAVVIALAALA